MRPIQKLYSMGGMLEKEYFMDKTLNNLCDKLDTRFVNPGVTCDISDYLNFRSSSPFPDLRNA